jgi:hypothetical protein
MPTGIPSDMYTLRLKGSERQVLISALRATVDQLDGIMEQGMAGGGGYEDLREVADASNALEDILLKLGEEKSNEQ